MANENNGSSGIGSHRPLAIDDAAALLAAIVASSNDAILSKTLYGIITSWNAATAELFGYTDEEMVGTSIRRLIPPDRQEEENEILASIAAGKRIENYETVRIRKDGTPIDVAITVSPIRDAAGTVVGASKIIRDLTERRRSERQVEALLREVNHRSKNLLGLVQAVANQTRAKDVEEFRTRFSARLQTLATNQDLLISRKWEDPVLAEIIEAEFGPFARIWEERVTCEGPVVHLSPAASQIFSMTIHELLTNALKYGALSDRTGRIAIEWSTSDGSFSMRWRESGGPRVIAPDKTGFGTLLMTRLVEMRLGGKVALSFASGGFEWRFTTTLAELAGAT